MPARKNSALNKRHDSKAEQADRESAEKAMTPQTIDISVKPPAELKGHPYAAKVWKRTVTLYKDTKGKVITAFDQDLLIKYCLAEEELVELLKLRNEIRKVWERHLKALEKMNPSGEDLKIYYNALAQANALLQRFQGMDARLDGKRKMNYSMAQSLYLTPRSRAGAAPEEKDPVEVPDDMDSLLDGKQSTKERKKK